MAQSPLIRSLTVSARATDVTGWRVRSNLLVTEIKWRTGVVNYFHYDARQRRYAMVDSTGLTYFVHDKDGLCPLQERDGSGNIIAAYSRGYSPIPGIGDAPANTRVSGGDHYAIFMEWGTPAIVGSSCPSRTTPVIAARRVAVSREQYFGQSDVVRLP